MSLSILNFRWRGRTRQPFSGTGLHFHEKGLIFGAKFLIFTKTPIGKDPFLIFTDQYLTDTDENVALNSKISFSRTKMEARELKISPIIPNWRPSSCDSSPAGRKCCLPIGPKSSIALAEDQNVSGHIGSNHSDTNFDTEKTRYGSFPISTISATNINNFEEIKRIGVIQMLREDILILKLI